MNFLLSKVLIVLASLSIVLGCTTPTPISAGDKKRMTLEEATVIALRELPGEILESELDSEDGVLAYDFEILKADGAIFEIEINAYDGSIISIEEE